MQNRASEIVAAQIAAVGLVVAVVVESIVAGAFCGNTSIANAGTTVALIVFGAASDSIVEPTNAVKIAAGPAAAVRTKVLVTAGFTTKGCR